VWVFAASLAVGTAASVLLRMIPGALVLDVVGPAIVAVGLAAGGSFYFSRSVPGWPHVPLRTWARTWIGFLGLLAVSIGFAIVVMSFRREIPIAVLRFALVGVAGAFALAAAGRFLARRGPPEPPPIATPSAR
jgi:hypothetical protein